jgi:hypothetical protein
MIVAAEAPFAMQAAPSAASQNGPFMSETP